MINWSKALKLAFGVIVPTALGYGGLSHMQKNYASEADRFISDHALTQSHDSIKHCYTSYRFACVFGGDLALLFGRLKETFFDRDKPSLSREMNARDSWRDRWNNAVGVRIYHYVKQHQLGDDDFKKLLLDAYKSNALIKYYEDRRIQIDLPPQPNWHPSPNWDNASVFKHTTLL